MSTLDILHQVLKIIFVLWGISFIVVGSGVALRGFLATNHVGQSERVRRALLVGAGVTLLAPGVTMIVYGFSADRILVRTILTICLTSICFSPVGLLAIVATYYRWWGVAKLQEDIHFMGKKLR